MSGLRTVLVKELRDGFRERRAVATALLFGPLLGPVLFGAMIGFTINQQIDDAERPIDVPVIGGESAPHLMTHLHQHMIDADTDAFGAATFAERREALRAAVRRGEVDVGIVIAPDFAAALANGERRGSGSCRTGPATPPGLRCRGCAAPCRAGAARWVRSAFSCAV